MILRSITLTALPDFHLVGEGDNIALLIVESVARVEIPIRKHTVFVVTQKIVSKAEGRVLNLQSVVPSEQALQLSQKCGKDPRLVEVILQESNEVLRVRKGLLITEQRLGFVCANAGVDQSNVSHSDDLVSLLPENPDRSARQIRLQLEKCFSVPLGVIITDTQGRAFRNGVTGTAIGCDGIPVLKNLNGKPDLFGRQLKNTELAYADEIAAAASLLMGQADEKSPVVVVQGLYLSEGNRKSSAAALIMPKSLDMFR